MWNNQTMILLPLICFLVGCYAGNYIPPLIRLVNKTVNRKVYRVSRDVILPPPPVENPIRNPPLRWSSV